MARKEFTVKRRRKIALLTISVVLLLLVAAAAVAWRVRAGASSGLEGIAVRIESPQQGDLVEFVNAPGQIEPLNKVLISARVSARIVELPYEEGMEVAKGDPDADPPVPASVLAKLDSRELEATLRSTEARRDAQAAQLESEKARILSQQSQIEGAKASLAKARIDLDRTTELVKSKDLSQSDLDQARSRYDELAAQLAAAAHTLDASRQGLDAMQHNLAAADADIARAKDQLNYTTITSPIDGVVTRRYSKVGELAIVGTMNNPGTAILEVADLSRMLLVAQVDESDIGDVKVGQKANVRIHTYPDEKFEGVVESIALTHDLGAGGAKYFKTKILLKESAKRIYSGLTADVDIETNKHEGVVKVPSQAIFGRPIDDLPLAIRDANPCVDVKKTIATVAYRFIDGKAVVTPVTIGPSDATHTIITGGLGVADRVIVGPYKVLEAIKHDQKVQDEREVEKRKREEQKKKEEAEGKRNKAEDSAAAGSTESEAK